MKIAPIMEAFAAAEEVETLLVHTGQHYDERMSRLFFEDLHIPQPDVNLNVGSSSHAAQTAEVMKTFEPVCIDFKPDWVLVVGDVNSTMACALVASKLGIRVAHVEAGLRSFDRTMPEEINRIVTDAISDLLFATEPSGVENLQREGVPQSKVLFVGNVMIDTLLRHRDRAERSPIRRALRIEDQPYALVTLHRPSNVDKANTFSAILNAVEEIARDMTVVFPMHPRTARNLSTMGLAARVEAISSLKGIEPLGYLDFLCLMSHAAVVLTDSGGVQEETTILNVPCLTLRAQTERPITVTQGTNRVTGSDPRAILTAYHKVRANPPHLDTMPALWDGHAAQRIAERLIASHRACESAASTLADTSKEESQEEAVWR